MSKFATPDKKGLPTAFYDEAIHGEFGAEGSKIPADGIKIPEADWQAHINGDLRRFNGTGWEPYVAPFDPAAAIAAQRILIVGDCATAITAGIVDAALGADHTYPTGERDQANMAGLCLSASVDGDAAGPFRFWSADANGVWARREHSAAQILQVGKAVRSHVSAQQDRYGELLDALAAIDLQSPTIEADIAAITFNQV